MSQKFFFGININTNIFLDTSDITERNAGKIEGAIRKIKKIQRKWTKMDILVRNNSRNLIMNQGDCNNNERIQVGLTPIQEFYSGKNIFITGGTGEISLKSYLKYINTTLNDCYFHF